jgi:hypothetical protein
MKKILGFGVAARQNLSIYILKKIQKHNKNINLKQRKKLKNCQIFFKEFSKRKIKHDLIRKFNPI